MKKLTQAVFSLPECPKDATIAVVNKCGSLVFGNFQDAKPSCGGWCGVEAGKGKWYDIRLKDYATEN